MPHHAATSIAGQPKPIRGFAIHRTAILSITKLLFLAITNFPLLLAAPLFGANPRPTPTVKLSDIRSFDDPEVKDPEDSTLWIYLTVAVGLVLLGGAFAGLTIALMGQDEIYLQVIRTSGDGAEKNHAAKVLRLLDRGKHWVLVTLLLGNVITNETLPIVLDRSLGGGWPAVLGSTVLIVIFGEIIPQSICVRYGLPIGAWMSPLVLILMYILAPVAWPTAKLLDRLLGEDHGTTYKKAGLKTLVTLHKTLGSAGEQLTSDEVTIISAVLDLKEKPVRSIMTPMDDVFTMSADTILDEKTMDIILSAGYSRIPIHAPDNPLNFVGMLLVKILITYDPEDCKAVRDFALATLPETWADTSCLDIVNYFQEGKSHMALVSENPGGDYGALGVVTLEDVIEELIGEEIIDESDVFVDVHKAIRRMAPAPRNRIPKGDFMAKKPKDESNKSESQEREPDLIDLNVATTPTHEAVRRLTTNENIPELKKNGTSEYGSSPKASYTMRRTSSVTGASEGIPSKWSDNPEMREHLKHLGPSNLAARPRQTRYNTVKIKPGMGTVSEAAAKAIESPTTPRKLSTTGAPQGGIGENLLQSAGRDAKDGVQAVQAGYGTMGKVEPPAPKPSDKLLWHQESNANSLKPPNDTPSRPLLDRTSSANSQSTIASLPDRAVSAAPSQRRGVRSGSITENIVEAGGIKKVVLELNSSSDDAIEPSSSQDTGESPQREGKENDKPENDTPARAGKKKRRRKRSRWGGENQVDEDGG